MKSKLTLLVLIIFFVSCEKSYDEFGYYDMLIDKEWKSQNGFESTHTFRSNKEYVLIRSIAVFNPETNTITHLNDTICSFWNLRDNVIMITNSNTSNISDVTPVDWSIIELNDTLLKVKLLSDLENPYILPWIFVSN